MEAQLNWYEFTVVAFFCVTWTLALRRATGMHVEGGS